MTKKYILSLDIGTSRVTAHIFDHNGDNVASTTKEISHYSVQPGWFEQDPQEIWEKLISCVTNILILGQIKPAEIASIGITNQRETTILWNKITGNPIHNALMWESRQSEFISNKLIDDGYSNFIHERTGLFIDPYFSATKIVWLLNHDPELGQKLYKGDLLFGTLDSWIVWKLTSGKTHVTDYTNASRTMLFNINTLEWDKDILKLLKIPEKMLPEVHSNSEIYAYTDQDVFFGAKIPIAGIAGDQQAAMIGQLALDKGNISGTYGTGAFIMLNTGQTIKRSEKRLITTIAYGIDGTVSYAVEGSIFVAGSAIQWLKNGLKLINSTSEAGKLAMMSTDNQEMYVVPAFTGLSAPYWDSAAKAASFGMTQETTNYDFIRATLESVAYQTTDVVNLMNSETSININQMMINGEFRVLIISTNSRPIFLTLIYEDHKFRMLMH
ncbi:glycerol kinase [Lentilactobacillus kosonis]|uniref:ATP:glycerol 3-phosphotransferase n=1 Tax=Lentilactobacillus kosonis TaxID=2810561 RepID=A0A401FMJ5_9LACO|nr:glycerol kinase [Lentilactobacillus kosonis]